MKIKRIFVGTIKKCNNLYLYKIFGDTHYEDNYRANNIEYWTIREYAKVIG